MRHPPPDARIRRGAVDPGHIVRGNRGHDFLENIECLADQFGDKQIAPEPPTVTGTA
jgi:hypothetical protein